MQDKTGDIYDRNLPGGQLAAKYADLGDGTWGMVSAPDARKYAVRLDRDVNGKVIYVGEAVQGTAVGAASWRIRQLTRDGSGNLTGILWANGKATFTQVWTARVGLSYS